MTKAVFHHKTDSEYDDRPDQYYHFPANYLQRVQATIGDHIVYYGPLPGLRSRYYTGTAVVERVRPDPIRRDHYYADVRDYLNFDRPVEYRENGGFEKRLVLENGKISGGVAVNAVRHLTQEEFVAILDVALSAAPSWPDREDSTTAPSGFAEDPPLFIARPTVEQLTNRAFRDRKFKQQVRQAYDRTCAFTGLRLINGGGRPEVEAAHIIPVEAGGNDSVRNGLALSGTVHWMFDRGFLSLNDDHKILVSRYLNSDVSHLLRKDMLAIVPREPWLRPHPDCLRWHRENRFKF